MAKMIDKTNQNQAVGRRTRRKDAADKVRGLTRYAGDMPVVGLLHARLVLSPYAHARIVNIDSSAAEAIPGVVAVYTSETLGMAHRDSSSRSQSPLAQKEVFWCGHPVAIVLAETEAAAEDGIGAVDVDYELLPVVMDPIAGMEPGAPAARLQENDTTSEIAGGGAHAAVSEDEVADTDEDLSQNVSDKAHYREGDMEVGWNEAEAVVERTYRTSFVHQSYIEPQSITVVPSTSGQQVTIWASSQGMFAVRSDVSEALNVPQRQIRVESVPIGGAFGGKFGLVEPLVASAAFAARKPVRLVYTRSEDLLAGNPAPQSIISVKLGARRDGTLVAMQAKVIFDSGAYAGSAVGLGGYLLGSTYRCPNLDIRCYEVLTNKVGVGAYRAPGAPQATFALESAVDELCRALQMDPLAFRLKNGLQEGDPTLDKRSPRWPRIGLLESVEKVREHPLWAKRAEKKEVPAELQGWKIGTGVAGVRRTRGNKAHDCAPAVVAHDNTDTMPYSGGTGGSKTLYSVGPAVLAAAQDARNQILTTAADMLEASSTDLEIEGDRVVVRGSPGKSIALKDIASAAMQFAGRYEPVYGRGRAAVRQSSPMYGAHVARVAVDPETGQVRGLDYVVAQDVGLAINPAEVEGQIFGGVTQGIGWALF